MAFSLHGHGDNEFGPFLLERRPGQQPGDRSVFFRLLGSYPSSSLAADMCWCHPSIPCVDRRWAARRRCRASPARPAAPACERRPAQRQPCWVDDQADRQERGQNIGETHVTAPHDCAILKVLQLMERPAIELAPRHLLGRARAYRRQVARADGLVVVARDRALVALGRDRPDNRGRVDGPAKPSASINAQTGLFPQAECRPRCRAGCQDDRVFNGKLRHRIVSRRSAWQSSTRRRLHSVSRRGLAAGGPLSGGRPVFQRPVTNYRT